MCGQLRIASARSPYRRAGLSWDMRAPVELHITQLSPEQLRELLADPVLAIQIADEHDAYRAIPDIRLDDMTDQALQLMIDSFAEFAPLPVEMPTGDDLRKQLDSANEEIARLRQIEAAWQDDQRHLHDQGYQTLDALTTAWAADRVKLAELAGAPEGKAGFKGKPKARPATE